ncbi:MAG: arsenite methyltransferase [Wenzhouxiangella sp.]|jgi:SAM-dependent methyltransferase|nr:arsenite methyltransferase [Wenzhouxiangella sp.]
MKSDDPHSIVQDVYGQALKRAQRKAATTPCCAVPMPAGRPVADESTATRYPEAAASSFGCGNPLAFAEVGPGQTVLDLGSGAGLDLLMAAEAVGPEGRVIGVDMTADMVEAARENIRRSGHTNIELRQGMIEDLPVEDASVDWVISNCVINLSPDKRRVFAEIARVLKPGGRISVSDMVVGDLPDWLRSNAAAYVACIGGAISEEEYVAGVGAAGLMDVAVTERHVYDAASLRALVASELITGEVASEELDSAVNEAAGKVWSIKVTGTKPAGAGHDLD